MIRNRIFLLLVAMLLGGGCGDVIPNNPYRLGQIGEQIYFTSFAEAPKTLDPTVCYEAGGYSILCQIYEPIVEYHYLKRPHELQALTAESVPVPQYYDKAGKLLEGIVTPDQVARVVYDIKIKKGIMYQPHPCFVKKDDGTYRYQNLSDEEGMRYHDIKDFEEKATRELIADDYVYAMKRMAHPSLNCPILPTLQKYILGIEEYGEQLSADLDAERARREAQLGASYNQVIDERDHPITLDLEAHSIAGIQTIDRYTFRVELKAMYPQMIYWMAMPFCAPIPREAIAFYDQRPLVLNNLSLERFPVGTGPYRLESYDPNREIVLVKNENYRDDFYPSEGEPGDHEKGLLQDAGKNIPFIDKFVMNREKESIPNWNKFLQGYYDVSGISDDSFDQAVQLTSEGAELSAEMKALDIQMVTTQSPSTYYFGFNMEDAVTGGYDEKKCKLRQAIAIAVDTEEYLQIFMNARGIVGHNPMPPGIFGYEYGKEFINPYTYDWDEKRQKAKRKTLEVAKQLLSEAGYPDGIDENGKPLVITFDTFIRNSKDKIIFGWLSKKLKAINIKVDVRATDYSVFQDKMKKGEYQMFRWGWGADYPDPENFTFLLYGPNSGTRDSGPNSANYDSPEYNQLFKQMEQMANGEERLDLIRKMNKIYQHDMPWFNVYHPKSFSLMHHWFYNEKPNRMANNSLKYKRIDGKLRMQYVRKHNKANLLFVFVIFIFFLLSIIPAAIRSYRRQRIGERFDDSGLPPGRVSG